MLEFLAVNKGRVVGRDEISTHVWDDSFDAFSNLIEVYIKRLRTKMDDGFPVHLIRTLAGPDIFSMMFSSFRVRLQPWFAFVTGVAIMIWSVMIYVVLFSTMLTSIRIRLTIWYTLVLSLTLISFSTLVYFSFVRVFRDETDASLLEMANNFVIAASAEQTDEIEARPLHDISEALDAFRFRDYQFGVISTDGNVVAASDEFFLPDLSEVDGTADSFADYSVKGQLSRIVQHSFRVGGANFRLIVIHSLEDRLALEERLRVSVLVAIPIALLLAGLGGYFLVRRSLQPVQTMSQRASLITSQNLHERLPVVNQKDELGNLATVFNDLLDRLEKSFAQHRRFMADASHELRTPLAIVRGESEVALSRIRDQHWTIGSRSQ